MTSEKLQLNACGLSKLAASFISTQNDLEKWRLMNTLLDIKTRENHFRTFTQKEINNLHQEFVQLVATGHVFRSYRFEKYDPYAKSKADVEIDSNNKNDTAFETTGKIDKNNKLKKVKRKLGHSVANLERINSEPDLRVPRTVKRRSLPNIHHIDVVDEKDVEKIVYQVPFVSREVFSPLVLPYNNQKNIPIWKQGKHFNTEKSKPQKRYRKKKPELEVKEDFKKMFPGNCKTPYSMRKFVNQRTTEMITQKDSQLYSKKKEKLDRLILGVRLPDIVTRTKTTSAIFKDFRAFKSQNKF